MKMQIPPGPMAGRQETSPASADRRHAAARAGRAGAADTLDTSPRQVAQRARLHAAFGAHVVQRDDGDDSPRLPRIQASDVITLMRAAAVSAWKTYAYHATKLDNVDSILRSGLDPRRGGTGAAAESEHFKAESRGRVHYSRSEPVAAAYKEHFEGGRPFGRQHPNPGPAGVLRVVLHRDQLATEEADPDSRQTDRAFRNTSAIPARNVRLMGPKPLPGPRRSLAPLQPGANASLWKDHVLRSFADTGALMSNMPPEGTDVLFRLMRQGHDIMTVMQMVRQGLQSWTAEDVLGWSVESREQNPRVNQPMMDVIGSPLIKK